MKNEIVNINGTDVAAIEYGDQRVITLSMIDNLHKRSNGTANAAFYRNRNHFVEGEDYYCLTGEDAREALYGAESTLNVDSKIAKLYLMTESGYLMLTKTFRDDLSWNVQRMLVKTYFAHRSQQAAPKSPSELIMMLAQDNVEKERQIHALEVKTDNHGQQLEAHEQQLEEVSNKVIQIADAIAAREVKDSWRKDTAHKINQIACSEGCSGDFQTDVKVVRHAIYDAIDRRCGVRLYTRLKHRKESMAENGLSKTKIEKLNVLDEIADNPKLIQAYTDIVSDFMIAFPWPEDTGEE